MILDKPIILSEFLLDLVRSYVSHRDVVVEIGSGELSTPLLAELCEELDLDFYTVDGSRARMVWAQELLRDKKNAVALCAKGEDFLHRFAGQVSFAYLDSYDWIDPVDPDAHSYPPGCSRRESELVHLEQTMELVKHLRPGGLVLFDDTWFLERTPPGSGCLKARVDFRKMSNKQILEEYGVFGKGSLAVPFLLCSGFEVLAVSERPHLTQVLLKKSERVSAAENLPYDTNYFLDLLREHRLVDYPVKGGLRAWLSTVLREKLEPCRELADRGFAAYGQGNLMRARVFLLAAIILNPRLIGNRGVLSILAESVVGSRVMEYYRRSRRT